jgi:uncharacterized alkaline shock family protein YloU
MSNPTEQGTQTGASSSGSADLGKRDQGGPLASSHGRTIVADVVVRKIAGMAAREVSGVHQLGSGAARTFGNLRQRIPGASESHGQGVAVEVGERQAAVDLDMLVDYGVAIPDLARAVRQNVMSAIERMTGLEVVEVNISVGDVYLGRGEEEDVAPAPSRVQ